MKRVNIYITEEQEDKISTLSDVLSVSNSEVVRRSVDEYGKKHQQEVNTFMETFNTDYNHGMDIGDPEGRFIRECSKDPKFFAENAVKINTPNHGTVRCNLSEVQYDLLDILEEYNHIIINKSRQVRSTSTHLLHLLHYAIFNPNKNIVVCAHKLAHASELLCKLKDMLMSMPKFMVPKMMTNNKRMLTLENGTQIIANNINACSLRGVVIHYLYMDEISFARKQDVTEFVYSVFPAMFSSDNHRIVLSSTPNGYNHFYQLWTDALTNYNNFKPVCIPWLVIPERDEDWKYEEIKRIGEIRFKIEYECKFIGNNILYPGQKEPRVMSFE